MDFTYCCIFSNGGVVTETTQPLTSDKEPTYEPVNDNGNTTNWKYRWNAEGRRVQQ